MLSQSFSVAVSYNSPTFIFKNTRSSSLLLVKRFLRSAMSDSHRDREDPLDISLRCWGRQKVLCQWSQKSLRCLTFLTERQSIFILRCVKQLADILLDLALNRSTSAASVCAVACMQPTEKVSQKLKPFECRLCRGIQTRVGCRCR